LAGEALADASEKEVKAEVELGVKNSPGIAGSLVLLPDCKRILPKSCLHCRG